MPSNQQLYWHQGLFLTPQHLQQQDLFHAEQQRYFWQLSQKLGWGVRQLQIREEGLADGQLEVLECELVTREGLIIRTGSQFSRQNADLEPRSFKAFLGTASDPLGVYVGLPRAQAGRSNLAVSETERPGELPKRYRLTAQECNDIFDANSSAKEVQFLCFNAKLLFDREEAFSNAEQAYELIKIAELLPLASGEGARLATSYIPPSLTVSGSKLLLERLQGICDLLTARAHEFASMKRQRGIRATASTGQELLRLMMLQSLNRYVPLFRHHLELGHIHPEPVYALLRQLIGELSVFSEEITVLGALTDEGVAARGLPAYDHEALWPCFNLAISRLQELIKAMTVGPETGIRLVYDGEYYKASLTAEVFEGERTRYYLMIDSLQKGDDLTALLQRTGKVSTLRDMPRLRQSALFGLKITYLPVPPEELPQRGTRNSYFAIDSHSTQWQRIKDGGNIALLCDLDPNDTVIKLFVVREE